MKNVIAVRFIEIGFGIEEPDSKVKIQFQRKSVGINDTRVQVGVSGGRESCSSYTNGYWLFLDRKKNRFCACGT